MLLFTIMAFSTKVKFSIFEIALNYMGSLFFKPKKWSTIWSRLWLQIAFYRRSELMIIDFSTFWPRSTDFQWSLFSSKSQTFGLGQTIWADKFWGILVFLADYLSAPILVQRVPCPCFPFINHYFYKKLSLYIQIPIIYLGFKFGPQRIRDLAFVCP